MNDAIAQAVLALAAGVTFALGGHLVIGVLDRRRRRRNGWRR